MAYSIFLTSLADADGPVRRAIPFPHHPRSNAHQKSHQGSPLRRKHSPTPHHKPWVLSLP